MKAVALICASCRVYTWLYRLSINLLTESIDLQLSRMNVMSAIAEAIIQQCYQHN